MDTEQLASRLLEVLRDEYSAMLAARYKLEKYDLRPLQGYELLELIGRKRGCWLPEEKSIRNGLLLWCWMSSAARSLEKSPWNK